MKNFRILHHGVDQYTQGQVVPQSVFGNTERLLRLGAVEETDAPVTILDEGDAPVPGLTTGKPEGLTEESAESVTVAVGGNGASVSTAPALPDALPQATIDALAAAGFDSAEKIAAASDDDLKKVPGVGDATVAKLRSLQGA